MKKILPLLLTFLLSGVFIISCAQNKEKKEVKKEIRVEQENGNTTVTISETKDGKVTKSVLTGEDAEKYLEEKNGSGQNSFSFSGDDEDGDHVVIIKEMDSEGDDEHFEWVSDDNDMHFDMAMIDNEMAEDVEGLISEIDELNKKEITARLEEIMKNHEEMEKEMTIKMESIHEGEGDIKVNVEEENGIITIEKTVNGKTTVKTIEMDGENKSDKNIYIIKTSNEDEDEDEK